MEPGSCLFLCTPKLPWDKIHPSVKHQPKIYSQNETCVGHRDKGKCHQWRAKNAECVLAGEDYWDCRKLDPAGVTNDMCRGILCSVVLVQAEMIQDTESATEERICWVFYLFIHLNQ